MYIDRWILTLLSKKMVQSYSGSTTKQVAKTPSYNKYMHSAVILYIYHNICAQYLFLLTGDRE